MRDNDDNEALLPHPAMINNSPSKQVEPALEACPFCGQEPIVTGDVEFSWRVECDWLACGVRPKTLDTYRTRGFAVEAWNARVSASVAPTVDAISRADVVARCKELEVKFNWQETGAVITGLRQFVESLPAAASLAAKQVKHHKHCSSWTVTTSGDKKPCDCVCECNHSMAEHIRRGEHSWYEECVTDVCPCVKFVAAAKPSGAREVAEEIHDWIFSPPDSWPIKGEATKTQLADIIERYFPAAAAPVAEHVVRCVHGVPEGLTCNVCGPIRNDDPPLVTEEAETKKSG